MPRNNAVRKAASQAPLGGSCGGVTVGIMDGVVDPFACFAFGEPSVSAAPSSSKLQVLNAATPQRAAETTSDLSNPGGGSCNGIGQRAGPPQCLAPFEPGPQGAAQPAGPQQCPLIAESSAQGPGDAPGHVSGVAAGQGSGISRVEPPTHHQTASVDVFERFAFGTAGDDFGSAFGVHTSAIIDSSGPDSLNRTIVRACAPGVHSEHDQACYANIDCADSSDTGMPVDGSLSRFDFHTGAQTGSGTMSRAQEEVESAAMYVETGLRGGGDIPETLPVTQHIVDPDCKDPFASFCFGSPALEGCDAVDSVERGALQAGKRRVRTKADGRRGSHVTPKRTRPEVSSIAFSADFGRPPIEHGMAEGSCVHDGIRLFLVDVTEGIGTPDGHEVWLHGVSTAGHSVAAMVQGFRPYFYCLFPCCGETVWDEDRFCEALASSLEDVGGTAGRKVVRATRMQRRPLMYYQRDSLEVLRVELTSARLLSIACRKVEQGFQVPGGGEMQPYDFRSPTWEGNVPLILRFMIDTGLVGGGWVEFDADTFAIVPPGDERQTNAQLELRAPVDGFRSLPPEGELIALAPLRILSLTARTDESGRIVSIAAVSAHHGEPDPMARVAWLLTNQQCDATEWVSVFCKSDEAELLEHFGAFVAHCDPDLIIGYELGDRVLSTILARCQAVQAGPWASQLGRMKGVQGKARRVGAPGSPETRTDVNADGRLLIDVARLVAQEHRLTSYSFPSVAQHFLGGNHFELRAADALELLATHPGRLAQQEVRDAEAVRLVSERLCSVYNLVGMARVTGVPMNYLLTRGQMIKVTSQLLRNAREHGVMLPPRTAGGRDTFEGGFVMEPKTGLYEEPIVVLDFASLYPSIMIAHNLCYTTLLSEGADRSLGLETNCVTASPAATDTGVPHKFVSRSLRRGLLPMILEELLAARKATKREMASTSDARTRAVLNARQLALKISANSVYGFTGASSGAFPCMEIAATVTAYGREMITSTAAFIESQMPDARVIYGDTDSVLVSFGTVPRMDAIRRGKEAARLASQTFAAPIQLEYEKVLQPYLLLNKKRYVGRLWNGDQALDLDMKGIETVRRDWCGLVRQSCEHALDLLLRPDRSVSGVVEYVREVVSELRRGTTDLRLLVISKTLGKKGEADYVAKAAHVELAEKLRERDPKTAPRPGDRVAYVIVAGTSGAKLYERAEDPQFVQRNGLPIDAEYYIEQQLKQPLLRILEPVVGGDPAKVASMVFAGNQGSRAAAPLTKAMGGLGAFLRRGEKCLACRVAIGGSDAFCTVCRNTKQAEIVRDAKLAEGRSLQQRQCVLRTICHGCVGPMLGEDAHLRCNNVACEIFFERAQVAKAVDDMQATFVRLNLDW